MIYTFQPIFTALFAWLLLGESMGPVGLVGGGIIGFAVYLAASSSMLDSSDDPQEISLKKLQRATLPLNPDHFSSTESGKNMNLEEFN